MPDDKTNRGSPDRERINMNEGYEVRHWSEKLGVTPSQLKEAVDKVGDRAADVRRHLGK